MLSESMQKAVEAGAISHEDQQACNQFLDMSGVPTVNIYIMAKTGKLDHLEGNEGFQATMRVLKALGIGEIEFDHTTAKPVEEQFWASFDTVYNLSEKDMREKLPYFVTDPNNRAKVEALLSGGENAKDALGGETT
jgi:hypothetical protein